MITAIVITKNEEKMIEVCLKSLSWVDELIIADNGSIDKTLEIAKKYTRNIFKFEGRDFAKLRNEAIKKAKGDWVLYIDADERVLYPLRVEIENLIKNSDKSAFAISRRNIILGKEVNYGPYKKDWMIRLLKKDKFRTWVGKVHEYATFEGELGYLKEPLLHLTHRNIDQIVLKSLVWSNIDARLRLDAKHPKITGLRLLKILFFESVNQGIKRRGFFNGTVGTIDAILQTFSLVITYIRLWQLQRPQTLEQTYQDIDKKLTHSDFNL